MMLKKQVLTPSATLLYLPYVPVKAAEAGLEKVSSVKLPGLKIYDSNGVRFITGKKLG